MKTKTAGRALCAVCAVVLLAGCQTAPPSPLAGNPLDGLALLRGGETMRSSSCDPDWANGNGDARPIAPGKTLTIAALEGPGVITHLWNTVAAQDREYSRMLVVRMYWDGEECPSVEVPLGDFFGMGHGKDHPFSSLPVTVTSEGRARNCYWPMPFRKSARITVTNEGERDVNAFYYYVDWHKVDRLPKDAAYFHAMYRQEHPAVMGRNYLVADIEGRGHYVGTLLNVRQRIASWWGEGDDFWFIDGAEAPQLRGTGSEDYFCDAWGLREMSTPFYGAPLMEGYEAMHRTTCYRWHITDPVVFRTALRLEFEHKGVTFNDDGTIRSGFEERPDDFSSVAFWYQTEPHKPLPPMAPARQRVYRDWSGVVEAEAALDTVKVTAGPVSTQDGGYSGARQLFWTPGAADQKLDFPLDVPADGSYELVLVMTRSWDYGTYEAQLDGKPLGAPMNLYSKNIVAKEHCFPTGPLAAGPHVLSLVNKGKDASSPGYFLGFDCLLLAPLP